MCFKKHRLPVDEKTFTRIFSWITSEYNTGQDHYYIYKDLNELLESNPLVNKKFEEFFRLTKKSHLELAYLSLMRLFDKNTKSESIKSFLLAAKDNIQEFKHCDSRTVKKEINKDLNWISESNNPDVRDLSDVRRRSIAHTDKKSVSSERSVRINEIFDIHSRKPKLVEKLFNEIGEILNKYNMYLWNTELSRVIFDKKVDQIINILSTG